jgi:hypothetical protein
MLTGYNTDVSYEGEIFHVQTEDKGLRTPIILSLVYQKGVILAAKRTPYEKFISDGVIDEKLVSQLLDKQHKTIIATLKAGKSKLLIELSKKQYEPPIVPVATPIPVVASVAAIETPDILDEIFVSEIHEEPEPTHVQQMVMETVTQQVSYIPKKVVEIPLPVVVEELPAVKSALKTDGKEASDLVENWNYDLKPGVEVVVFNSPSFDSIMDQYLEATPALHALRVELLHPSNFWAGEEVVIRFAVLLESHNPATNANVKLQILGNKIKSELYEARTDYQGLVSFKVKLPQYTSGAAAIVVNATGQGGLSTELRYMILKR